jgi:hypothetical protein
MGAPISLFSGYSQGENRTTNYCLLVLKMLYEENPKLLAEVLGTLVSEQAAEAVGVQFLQQAKKAKSVPDGLIFQKPFTVYIETKSFDWFYDSQIENHLDSLKGEGGLKVFLALSNFEGEYATRFSNIEKLCEKKYRNQILFSAISFDDFLHAVSSVQASKNLLDAVEDFRAYLDEEALLPSWQQKLDVVNCATMTHEVLQGGVYICPATGGNYNHQRAKYFGMYRWKKVERIAIIRAVVEITAPGLTHVRWNNTGSVESDRVLADFAERELIRFRPKQFPHRVFALGDLYETDFRKDTKHGMRTSKQYFDIENLAPADASDLAVKLNGMSWSQLIVS